MYEILAGVLQGITEFLPVSSSGHLVIFSSLNDSIDLNTYDIAFLHVGTLLSIIVYYRKRIIDIFSHKKTFTNSMKIIAVALIPAVAVGLLSPLQEVIDSNKNILQITGAAYLIFSIILLVSLNSKDESAISFDQITLKQSFIIGLAQAFALVPGISRSGITLVTGMYLGIKKTEAIYFSLLLGIPTIFGAWLLTFVESSFNVNTNIVAPTIVAFISGILAIRILISITVNSKLQYFAFYCIALSVICFIN
ncbi:MAG: undecaprenyl-diphosphate phosphatase [Candidatus Actinomarina sp.]|nr:undecaprenyl-diphosphate phosphatase [Candidatus Actinomarina sp.]MBL6836663.1 undecaprenyl-diphosphate phosphatase [Candidatus Actinomarina sp.]